MEKERKEKILRLLAELATEIEGAEKAEGGKPFTESVVISGCWSTLPLQVKVWPALFNKLAERAPSAVLTLDGIEAQIQMLKLGKFQMVAFYTTKDEGYIPRESLERVVKYASI